MDGSRIHREVITLGRLQGAGKRAKQDIADYVLTYRGQKLAVIEATEQLGSVSMIRETFVGFQGYLHAHLDEKH